MKLDDDQLYQVYLLRLWRNRTDAPWRVSLESTANSTQHHFVNIRELAHFLETTADPPTSDAD